MRLLKESLPDIHKTEVRTYTYWTKSGEVIGKYNSNWWLRPGEGKKTEMYF